VATANLGGVASSTDASNEELVAAAVAAVLALGLGAWFGLVAKRKNDQA
jgi:hypothetical protein